MQNQKKTPTAVGVSTGVGKSKKRILKGIVISDKMDKTIVVLVEQIKQHPRYRKRYRIFKKYKAHDSNNQYKVGDKVTICESRPISKDKRWQVIG